MKKVLFGLSLLSSCLFLFSTFTYSQQETLPEEVWSKVRFDGERSIPNLDPNFKYKEAAQITRIINLINTDATVAPNFRLKPGTNTTQSEMSIDIHPSNPDILFAGANATNWPVSTLYGTGVYWSVNGSLNWTGYDNPPFGGNQGDPANVIGANGFFYVGYINGSSGQGISVSTNNGTNWSNYTVAPNPGSLADKNHLMVDKVATSPYANRVYAAWTDFGGTNDYDVVFRYSTNNGANWSSSINLSNALSSYLNQGVNIQTGPNGEVYASWAVYNSSPVTNGEDRIAFAKSTNGGVTWGAPINVYQSTNFGIRGNLKPTQIRVSSFPSMAVDRSGGPRNGTIYITWPQRGVAPAGTDPDIVMVKSTDGGTTWSAPVRVNDDPINNGKDQYYPWMTVDQSNGNLLFVFYDNRETSNDSSGVYVARSTDGGTTFENFRVSDQNFKPKPINGLASGYQGDYIGIVAANDKAYPLWCDDRTGNYQGWSTIVSFGPPCPVEPATNPSPANNATNVPITLSQLTWTNGANAVTNELYFGTDLGNLQLVQSGSLATSWNVAGPLQYNTTYYWKVVEIGATCNAYATIWQFTTEDDPAVLFNEPFPNLNNWTLISGSSGGSNWSINSSSNAGGSSPELMFSWTPSFNGFSGWRSIVIPVVNGHNLKLQFKHYLDYYSSPSGVFQFRSTYNGGSTTQTLWELNNPTGNIGPQTVTVNFQAPTNLTEVANLQLDIVYNGNSFNIDYWYIDDVVLTDLDYIPVELTSFTAEANDNQVELRWSTATETNNQGFEVERKSQNGQFEKVGYVPGFGTTTEARSYSFIDPKVVTGNYTYRLKQIDLDGSFEYSNIVEVYVQAPKVFALEQNYPNPFNPTTVIKYSIATDEFVNVSVYDVLGEKVATLVNGNMKAGRYEINFDATKLSSGIYFYTIEAGSFKATKKMMLTK
jgi:hypothetical protein